MSLIKPNKDEIESDFISRFMANEIAIKEFPNKEQRVAVAHSTYSSRNDSMVERDIVIRLDSKSKYEITPEGYLKCDACIAVPGILKYPKRVEYLPPEECFDDESIETAKLKPIVMDHAFDGIQYNTIDAKNITQYQIGYSGENIKKDKGVIINVLITHKDSVDHILEKHREGKYVELSMCYKCSVVGISGETPDNKHYDAIQTKRRYNHLSVVEKGRAGQEVRLKFDKKGVNLMGKKIYTKNAIKLDSFSSDAINVSVTEENVEAFDRVTDKFDEAINVIEKQDTIIKNKISENSELQAKYDQAQEISDTQKQTIADLRNPNSEAFQSILTERRALEQAAEMFKVDCKDLDNKSIKLAVIKNTCEKFDATKEYADEYINGRFSAIVELFDKETFDSNNEAVKNLMIHSHKTSTPVDPRAEFIKKSNEMNAPA